MELVKQFNSELSSLYESKPPISKAKMTSITRTAIKAIKLYKHVVQSVEKFIQKCKPEYKVPGLYVIDSIVRQSRHQFGTEKDVFAPRFARNLQQTFVHLFNCPPEDKSKVIRVLNLWQKNAVFESEVIQPLFDLADPNHPVHKEQAALAPSNGITPAKPVPAANITPKNVSAKKEGGTAGWVNQLHTDPTASSLHSSQVKPHAPSQVVDVSLLQQLQHLQTLLMDQQSSDKSMSQIKDSDQVKFDKKLLDFDYGEEEDEDGPPTQHHHQQQQQQVVASLDSIGSILSNPEVLRQLQTLQQTLSNPQQRQQQLEMEEKLRKIQEMRQQEEEFDKHLAQTVPNLPFADECELKPGGELAGFPGMDLSQPPPGYPPQGKIMVPSGMMLKPPPSPLEDGEHASSDADERMGRSGEDGGPSVVVLDSDSPSDSPAHSRRRRRRSRSRSHRRSRSDSRSRSRNKRKRSSSYDDKDWEKVKQRESEKEKERERKRKGLPTLKKNHLAVCSTTLWIGHLSKLVQQEELSDTFGEFGDIVSIDLIPPRGCAFICMNRRQDAYRALQDLKHHKLQGKAITLAWAPGKGMKGKEYKDYWEVEQGVSYIPWSKLTQDLDLELLEEGGMVDEESFPEWLKERQRKNKDDDHIRSQSSSQAEEDDDASKGTELDIPVPAPTLPGYIPLPDGPQPDLKVNQPPPNLPPMMTAGPGSMPPLSMMPPFGLTNVPRLLGPMGMAMGPGLMPNVPLGVPPPGMQGLMGNPLMHQQMMSRMPQPVGSPFNPPPGVGILGGHPQLSQIPLPGSQEKGKGSLPPLGVPPPNDGSGLPPFGDPLMQIPFTLPPQLQMPGLGMIARAPLTEKQLEESTDKNESQESSSPPSRTDSLLAHFGHPPPQFSPLSLMKIPPPTTLPPPNKSVNISNLDDKDDREQKDKDFRDSLKDYKDKDRERDRDYRNKRDRDYRGDRDYRDRFDKDYRERDKDYRDKDRDRKDRRERSREREKDDKGDQDFREKEVKIDDKDRKEDTTKEDKSYRDRGDREKGRNRDRERDRERDRGRDRMGKWSDRERGRDRDRDEKRGRDRERDRSKEMKGSGDREKGAPNLQDRLRTMAHDQDRGSEFTRGSMESDNFQGPGGSKFGARNEPFHQDGFPPEMHGHHRREGFNNRGPRDMFDHRGPQSDGFNPRGPPMDNFGPRGSLSENFGLRGPPPDGFGPIGPPPEGFDPRGPPPGGFVTPDGYDPRGPPPDFDGQVPPPENFVMRGPPPDNFNRGLVPDSFGPGGPPPDGFRGPPGDDFGPQGSSFDGFSGPPGEFQPRIRIEFFARGRGRGIQDNFRGRGGRGGTLFSPRGEGSRGPGAGMWMDSQGPSPTQPGFGFPLRGFAPSETSPERFGPPIFEDSGRVRGGLNIRGRGRGFQGRPEDRRREEEVGAPSPKRSSRWSNPSPPPLFANPSPPPTFSNPSPPPIFSNPSPPPTFSNPSPPEFGQPDSKHRMTNESTSHLKPNEEHALPDREPSPVSQPNISETVNNSNTSSMIDDSQNSASQENQSADEFVHDVNDSISDISEGIDKPYVELSRESQFPTTVEPVENISTTTDKEARFPFHEDNSLSPDNQLTTNTSIQEQDEFVIFSLKDSMLLADAESSDSVSFNRTNKQTNLTQVSEISERSLHDECGVSDQMAIIENRKSRLERQSSQMEEQNLLDLQQRLHELKENTETPEIDENMVPSVVDGSEENRQAIMYERTEDDLQSNFHPNVQDALTEQKIDENVHMLDQSNNSIVQNESDQNVFTQNEKPSIEFESKENIDSFLQLEPKLCMTDEPQSGVISEEHEPMELDISFDSQPNETALLSQEDSAIQEAPETTSSHEHSSIVDE